MDGFRVAPMADAAEVGDPFANLTRDRTDYRTCSPQGTRAGPVDPAAVLAAAGWRSPRASSSLNKRAFISL